jgi:hypothetical protein
VPLLVIRKYKEGSDDTHTSQAGMVALLGHPCAVYAGGKPVRTQPVAQVRKKAEACRSGYPFEPPWEGYSALFPLPDFVEGEDYVVDFKRLGIVHFEALNEHRIACLTHEGWAAFQKRYAYHSLRANIDMERVIAATTKVWNEFEVWERWCQRGLDPQQYQTWLQEPQETGTYAGTKRDDLLEHASDEVLREMPIAPARLTFPQPTVLDRD